MELVIIGTREATIAGVGVTINGVEFLADGTAKRDPRDKDNVEIAELLAAARAINALGAKLEKRANGLIKHADDMRLYREVQKNRKNALEKKKSRVNKTLAKVGAKG